MGGYIDHVNKQLSIQTHQVVKLVDFFKKIQLFVQIEVLQNMEIKSNIEALGGKPSTIYARSKLDATKFLFNFTKNYFI